MYSFRDRFLHRQQLPLSSVWLMTDIAEAKGRQHLYLRQSPQAMASLREAALVQSVESSNRIEVLRQLQKDGRVQCIGKGPGALWRRQD
ncbi:MAG TPA: hypothetical protein VF179_21510 [Thermoanaerobaculia bacterium]|nr:hypothetical protein [Thermoanaerobaculia bacterium]